MQFNARSISQIIDRVADKVTLHPSTIGVRGPDTVIRDSVICEDCGCFVYAGFVDDHVAWHYDMQVAAERKVKKELVKMVEEMQDV
jgi:transcription initiation factor TFIIIB Brf1 subunit/transcription initiation factor TFIIB